jgi:hypothetical protein
LANAGVIGQTRALGRGREVGPREPLAQLGWTWLAFLDEYLDPVALRLERLEARGEPFRGRVRPDHDGDRRLPNCTHDRSGV